MSKTIAIFGQKQMGKTDGGQYIVDFFNNNGQKWKTLAFADAIKDSFCELFGVTREFIEIWKENPSTPPGWQMTVRKALQFIGDGFRGIKSDVWIAHTLNDVKKWDGNGVVIVDGRYINEFIACKKINSIVMLIYRPGFLNDIDHPSEKQVKPILDWFLKWDVPEGWVSKDVKDYIDINSPSITDYVDLWIKNDGTKEQYQAKIEKYMRGV
jgi:hypothetical protein